MSKSGEKMDVEDVLLSIRQLVSEELRTSSGTERSRKDNKNTDTSISEEVNAVEPDKLILAPSTGATESDKLEKVAADLERRMADIESFVMSDLIKNARAPQVQEKSTQIAGKALEDEAEISRRAGDTTVDSEPKLSIPEPKRGASTGAGMFVKPIDYSDRENLHKMISEVVRSELQGKLGDRITRNVRKLVIREINRALSTREVK